MATECKPPMFGPSGIFDTATYEPRSGKIFWAARPSLPPLSAPSQFAADVLKALGCLRDALESDGVSLAALSRVLNMKSTPEGDHRIVDALQELKKLVPALSELRYSAAGGLVRAGDVHQ